MGNWNSLLRHHKRWLIEGAKSPSGREAADFLNIYLQNVLMISKLESWISVFHSLLSSFASPISIYWFSVSGFNVNSRLEYQKDYLHSCPRFQFAFRVPDFNLHFASQFSIYISRPRYQFTFRVPDFNLHFASLISIYISRPRFQFTFHIPDFNLHFANL